MEPVNPRDWGDIIKSDSRYRHTFPPIYVAIADNDLEAVHQILQSQPDVVHTTHSNANTPLNFAVTQHKINIEIVRLLLVAAKTRHKAQSMQIPLLHSAAGNNNRLDIVKLLVENEYPIDLTDDKNRTALHHAVLNSDGLEEPIINFLIEDCKIDSSIMDSSQKTALDIVLASTGCQNQVVRLSLIEKLFRLEYQNKPASVRGVKLLDLAIAKNQFNVVKRVIDETPDLREHQTILKCLLVACGMKYIYVNIVKFLLAKVKLTLQNAKDLVKLALDNRRSDIVGLLMERSTKGRQAVISVKVIKYIAIRTDNFQGFGKEDTDIFEPLKHCTKSKIINLICLRACSMNVAVGSLLKFFNFTPVELNQCDKFGWTMLHHAVDKNHLECVRQLLSNRHVQKRAETFERETALFLACAKKDIQKEIVCQLLASDPQAYRQRNITHKSVLDSLVKNERVDLIELLRSTADNWVQENQTFEEELDVTLAMYNSVTSRRPNFQMIKALATFRIPEWEKLRILMLPETCKYEWGPSQNEIVLEKLLDIFFAPNRDGQVDKTPISNLIRRYLKEFSTINRVFLMHLLKKIPCFDPKDLTILYLLNRKCLHCLYNTHAYAILALCHNDLATDLTAEASAKGQTLLHCLIMDFFQNEKYGPIILKVLEDLISAKFIILDHADIFRVLGTVCKNLMGDYNYDKHLRALAFIQHLVRCGMNIDELMKSIETLFDSPKYHNVMYHISIFKLIMPHLIADKILMGQPLNRMWLKGFKTRVFLLNYGLRQYSVDKMIDGQVQSTKQIAFKAPSSLMRICRNTIYIAARNNGNINDYWYFVDDLACPETVKVFLKYWPDAKLGQYWFHEKQLKAVEKKRRR